MIGPSLLIVGLVSSVSATAAFAYALRADGDRFPAYGRRLLAAGAVALVAATLSLSYQFVVTDYTNGFVWAHTVDSLPLAYRLSGLFAGVPGALLFWAACVALAAWRIADAEEAGPSLGLVAAGVASFFAVLVVVDPPFTPLELSSAGRIVGPRGLNPLLVNPYMAIHPPVTFVAYALTLFPFSLGIIHLVRLLRGREDVFDAGAHRAAVWLRGAWTLLTASLALGALWSYYTLGWGGLWAWDPVQTASLVAWLVVTAALHALDEYRRSGTGELLAVSLATLPFPTVLFVRVVTQTGILTSVHAFGVQFDPLLLAFFTVSTTLAVGLAVACWIRAGMPTPGSATASTASVPLFLGVAAIYTWGVVFPAVNAIASTGTATFGIGFFNLWSYPVVVALLVALGHSNVRRVRRRRAWFLSAAVVGFAAVGAVAPIWQFGTAESGPIYRAFGRTSLLSLFPPAVYAFGTELVVFAGRVSGRRLRAIVPPLGTALVHVGIVLLVLSVPLSYVAAGPTTDLGPVPVGDKGVDDDTGYSLIVHDARTTARSAGVTFTDEERRLIREQVHEVGFRADALPPSDRENVVVWGEIEGIEANGSETDAAVYRMTEGDVRVRIQRSRDDAQLPQFEPGQVIYAQGSLAPDDAGNRVVETDERFVGRDPTDAVMLERRTIVAHADVSVRDGDATLARGTVGIRSAWNGNTVDVLVSNGPTGDVYVVPGQIARWEDTHLVSVSAERIPGMPLVRLAIGALLLGGVFRLWNERVSSSRD